MKHKNKICYQITPDNIHSHLFGVEMTFASEPGKSYTLNLPAWLPGSYMIRDFAKNIIELSAVSADGQALATEKSDKQTWHITATDEQVSLSYQVFAFDLSVRTAYLDSQRGFFNGSSTFLAVEELRDHACQLTINPPGQADNWQVATGMSRATGTEKYAFGDYIAADYHELIDCPVAIGVLDTFEFTVEGVVHHLVFTSGHYGDHQRLADDVAKLCQHHIKLFGEVPFTEYWFITHLLASGFGGLEHKNSTVLQASRFDLPNPNKPEELSDNYKTFLSLCSHEYFHAWNVCRIKPKEFVPYNLQKESHTKQLWAYEGITSYYDDFSLFRAGIIPFEQYLELLSKTATRVYRGGGELKQSVTESSFDAWTKFYQQGPDAVNNIVSYYTKGSLIALWLDLTIREKSAGLYSLDTLMRELWIHFGRPGIGTQEDDFINIANILCGEDIGAPFKALLHTPDRVALAPLLEKVGVSFEGQKFKSLNSLDTIGSEDYVPYLGAQYKEQAGGLKISVVVEGSPAAKAGLAVNDVLIAVDNLKVTEKSLQQLGEHLSAGQAVSCFYFRDDQLLCSEIAFTDSPLSAIKISVTDAERAANWQNIIA
ncbi:M61 family metallopeptidase [Thalassomonas actiniarum]|uniref:M61 family metallopeptidase n=1 Tax=Thalassomonas actiniarum TaxID=485447 RepID=A0AAE9YRA4_9GAMM|nr:PDZ domain-containing protein [Thalassomonas actiniarum]WDD99421.1 M61 family metallopeptidase [Thalassomonas actiniarum]